LRSSGRNEAFSRVQIDAQLNDQGWDATDSNSVRFEYLLTDGTRSDYVLCDRNGWSLAVVEAKGSSINPADAADMFRAAIDGRAYVRLYRRDGSVKTILGALQP
jgi:type I site-specific restriction endonuclease